MKTFETEKGNIPEGATHYRDGGDSNYFAWYKRVDGVKYRWVPGYTECWDAMDDRGGFNYDYVKPIPQTNIEAPEEKEVEWVNGDDVEAYGKLYKYVGLDPFNDNLCICLANKDDDPQCFSIEVLNKPETEAERVEGERLEAAYDLYLTHEDYIDNPVCSLSIFSESNEPKNKWLAIVDKTNYRKESE